MNWKNQLTKTPYLVLFMVLISIGVGTASALITITLAGDVHVTGDTTIDGVLSVGIDNPSDDDFIRFDSGNENIQWDESQTRFRLSDSIVTGGHFAAGSISADDTVNRFGDGAPQSPDDMTGPGDLYLADDLEVTDNIYVGGQVTCTNCILDFYRMTVIGEGVGQIATGVAICDEGDQITGGGYSADGVFQVEVNQQSLSSSSPEAWKVFIKFEGAASDITVSAICADYPPVHVP